MQSIIEWKVYPRKVLFASWTFTLTVCILRVWRPGSFRRMENILSWKSAKSVHKRSWKSATSPTLPRGPFSLTQLFSVKMIMPSGIKNRKCCPYSTPQMRGFTVATQAQQQLLWYLNYLMRDHEKVERLSYHVASSLVSFNSQWA